jgi:dihydrofolate reductase
MNKLKGKKYTDYRVVTGSATLVQLLMQHDLINEYQLLVFPIVLESGKRLFQDCINKSPKLMKSKTFRSGVALLSYQPKLKTNLRSAYDNGTD